MNRRSLVKLLCSIPVVSLIPALAWGNKAKIMKKDGAAKASPTKSGPPKNLMGEKEPLANAMKYKHDANKVKGMRTNKKAFCNNCDRWNKCNTTDKACKPGKDAKADYLPCNLFPNKVVANKGWCLSWQAIAKK